jgi:hypothetical protein
VGACRSRSRHFTHSTGSASPFGRLRESSVWCCGSARPSLFLASGVTYRHLIACRAPKRTQPTHDATSRHRRDTHTRPLVTCPSPARTAPLLSSARPSRCARHGSPASYRYAAANCPRAGLRDRALCRLHDAPAAALCARSGGGCLPAHACDRPPGRWHRLRHRPTTASASRCMS